MQWEWQVFCQDTITQEATQGCFGKGGDITYMDWMLSAWGWTVSVSLLSLAVALLLGLVVGTLRTLEGRPWVVRLGNAWVELFRNIPLLVHIFMWYHVVPAFFCHEVTTGLCACTGVFHLRTHCRASALGPSGPATRAAPRGHGTGLYHLTVLPLCIVANGIAHHHSAHHQ